MNFWPPWNKPTPKPQITVATTKRKEVDTSISNDIHMHMKAELRGAKVPYLPTPRERAIL